MLIFSVLVLLSSSLLRVLDFPVAFLLGIRGSSSSHVNFDLYVFITYLRQCEVLAIGFLEFVYSQSIILKFFLAVPNFIF